MNKHVTVAQRMICALFCAIALFVSALFLTSDAYADDANRYLRINLEMTGYDTVEESIDSGFIGFDVVGIDDINGSVFNGTYAVYLRIIDDDVNIIDTANKALSYTDGEQVFTFSDGTQIGVGIDKPGAFSDYMAFYLFTDGIDNPYDLHEFLNGHLMINIRFTDRVNIQSYIYGQSEVETPDPVDPDPVDPDPVDPDPDPEPSTNLEMLQDRFDKFVALSAAQLESHQYTNALLCVGCGLMIALIMVARWD